MKYFFQSILSAGTLFVLCWVTHDPVLADTQADIPPLQPEQTGTIEKLPEKYPLHWLFVHDGAFFHMLEGRMVVIDPLEKTQPAQFKGMFNISFMGHFVQAATRPELYVAEIFHSRGVRGERTDVITIYDNATLAPVEEIVLPVQKIYMGMPNRYALSLIDDERLLLLFNLTPATSVTVIDIVNRKVLNEVAIPGCSLAFPTGKRGFSSLCSNGGMLSTQLDADGQVILQQRVDAFFDVDKTPVFDHTAIIDGIAYFPGFRGEIHPVDLRGEVAVPGKPWNPVSAEEQQAGWRPGGLTLIDTDADGNFYLIMHQDGMEGTQQGGGEEIWVINPRTRKRVQRIPLQTWGLSLAVTKNSDPLIAVTNVEMNVDIYKVKSGEYLRTISEFGNETPLILHGVK